MTVLFIILGIMMTISGFAFMATPLETFLNAAYFIAILVLVYGIAGIISAIRFKRFGLLFAFDILSVLFGITALRNPQLILVISGINLMLAAIWFILMGIVSITTAVTRRKDLSTGIFILQLILGIFAVLIGISSFFQPLGLAIAEGTLIGIYFIEAGITMITVGAAAK